MTSGDIKEYRVALSDAFITRMRDRADASGSASPTMHAAGSQNFTIRYSVPPELLKKQNCELSLRKTTRGEVVVEDASAISSTSQGTGREEGSNNAGNARVSSGPSFRGPATPAQEDECVLIYNEETQQYELHLLNYNFQVAPVLKSRPKTSNGSSGAPNNVTVLRERPTATGQQAKSRASPTKDKTASRGRILRESSPAQTSSKASTGESKVVATAASLDSVRKSGELLDSHKAKPDIKETAQDRRREVVHRSQSKPSQLSSSRSSQVSPAGGSSQAPSPAVPASPASLRNSPAPGLDVVQDSADTPNPLSSTDQDSDPGLDEAFDDLADELEGEMDEDEERPKAVLRSLGTAGGSADDEDVSSEEE